MTPNGPSEYNREQLGSFLSIKQACDALPIRELEKLREIVGPYLEFRRELDRFHASDVVGTCRARCFETGLSACCGFESIFTFFADQVVTWLFSTEAERETLLDVLRRPNRSRHCVYLGPAGCRWKISPISCVMFLCDDVKRGVSENPGEAGRRWTTLQAWEKAFTYPVEPVLFDDLEVYFMGLGVDSPHMYNHRSPGLMRLKSRWRGKEQI